jgi:hypothetical protein
VAFGDKWCATVPLYPSVLWSNENFFINLTYEVKVTSSLRSTNHSTSNAFEEYVIKPVNRFPIIEPDRDLPKDLYANCTCKTERKPCANNAAITMNCSLVAL